MNRELSVHGLHSEEERRGENSGEESRLSMAVASTCKSRDGRHPTYFLYGSSEVCKGVNIILQSNNK